MKNNRPNMNGKTSRRLCSAPATSPYMNTHQCRCRVVHIGLYKCNSHGDPDGKHKTKNVYSIATFTLPHSEPEWNT